MDKEQQIKEMANITYDKIKKTCVAKLKDISEALYNAGYRKIDDDCAVITKDELKKYKVQAVKEFAERFKNGLSNCSGCYIPDCFERATDEFAYSEKDLLKLIYELLKE